LEHLVVSEVRTREAHPRNGFEGHRNLWPEATNCSI
jgi:hypothetical protein